MTPKQKRFVEEYSISRNSSDAARRAHYAAGSAHVTGSQLLRNPKVLEALHKLEDAQAQELDLTREKVLTELLEAIAVAKLKGYPATAIAGWKQVGLLCGFYRAETLHRAEMTDSGKAYMAKLEDMSDSELLAIIDST